MSKILTEEKAEALIKNHVPVAKSMMAKKLEQAAAASAKLKFPVVLKLISPKVIHKTEMNAVRFANSKEELVKEYNDLMKFASKKKLKPTGILVQELVKGQEVIIGIKDDPVFGHVLVFGIGGKFVELIRDVSFRACPITEKDAADMIDELKFKKVLFGIRGDKAVNMKLLKKILVGISRLPDKIKNIEEMDINPFIINNKNGKAVDARISLK